ncbi:MAG: Ig-like domain-containing protein, partial [Christensenellales bacterium]
ITGYYEDIKKTGSVTISNGANASLSYKATSSNTSVVTVSMSGNSMNYTIVGIGNATATIEVTTAHYVGAAYVNFKILEKTSIGEPSDDVEYVELNYSSFTIYVGDTLTLVASGNYSGLTWTSSNTSVASVNKGIVTAKSAGSTTITAKSSSGAVAQCYVTVKAVPSGGVAISVSPTSATLYQGATKQLTPTGSYSSVSWGSSNSNIASVNSSGLVTASSVNTGTVTITAYAKDSNGNTKATATASITVVEVPTTITLNINHTVVNKGTNVVVTANLNKTGTVTWNSTTSDSYETKNGNTLTISTSSLAVGTYTVTATYGSASAQVSFEVQDPNAYPANGYIYTLAQLNSIRYNLNKTYILAADIDVGNWTPIGTYSDPFTGTLKNLDSYSLSGIIVSGVTYAGLFGYTSKASISGMIIKDSDITGTVYVGGIVGYASSSTTISSCKVTSTKVTTTAGTGYAGGIVGRAYNSSISNCTVSATISASGGGYAGGIVGYSNSSVSSCLVTSTISAPTSSTSYAGGIVGYTTYKVSTSTIRSSTITGYYAGGIAGTLNRGDTIKLTFSEYKKGYRYEDLDTANSTLSSASVSIDRTAVRESTTVKGVMVGGLIGVINSGLVKNCYTRATLNGTSGSSYKGGLACSVNASGSFKNAGGSGQVGIIMNCYAAVKFSGSGNSYAVTRSAIHNHTITDSTRSAGYIMQYVFDNNTDGGATYSYGNTGVISTDYVKAKKSTSEMKTSSTYTEKGFSTSYWNLSGYPTLKTEK